MKIAYALFLVLAATGMALPSAASAQDARTVVLRFRKAGDTVAIRDAQLTIDHTIEAVTDSAGIARIPDLEDGGHIIEVVARGYDAFFENFSSGPAMPTPLDFEIRAFVPVAKPKGEPTELRVSDFEQRRAVGHGRFFTLAQLTAADGRPLSNFLKVDAGAVLANGPNNESYLTSGAPSRAAAPCYAAVVRDGFRIYPLDGASPPDLDKIFTDNLASIEFYAGAAPTGLGVASQCGALVLWSRHP